MYYRPGGFGKRFVSKNEKSLREADFVKICMHPGGGWVDLLQSNTRV